MFAGAKTTSKKPVKFTKQKQFKKQKILSFERRKHLIIYLNTNDQSLVLLLINFLWLD